MTGTVLLGSVRRCSIWQVAAALSALARPLGGLFRFSFPTASIAVTGNRTGWSIRLMMGIATSDIFALIRRAWW